LKNIILIVFFTFFFIACKQTVSQAAINKSEISQSVNASVEQAFNQHLSNVQVEGQGEVIKLLADDNNGLRHQKFLVKVSPSQTLLFAYNLDLAPRIEPLAVGDRLEFKGEYVYNPKGGIVHWTHKDPQGIHEAGWVKHNGKIYE
jgi:hypothetical protein